MTTTFSRWTPITRHVSRVTCHALAVAGIGLLIALAGCAGAPSPKTNFYSLTVEAAPARAQGSTGAEGGPVTRVLVSRVAIPGIVDRPQMVSRSVSMSASNSVEVFDFHRWAEPLQDAIPRVIAANLALELGPGHAVSASLMPGLPPDVRISVDVQKFEATLGTGVAVEVLWSVRPGVGEARVGRSVIDEPAPEAGHAGIAAAYSRALAAVARDLAAAVSGLPALQKQKRDR